MWLVHEARWGFAYGEKKSKVVAVMQVYYYYFCAVASSVLANATSSVHYMLCMHDSWIQQHCA